MSGLLLWLGLSAKLSPINLASVSSVDIVSSSVVFRDQTCFTYFPIGHSFPLVEGFFFFCLTAGTQPPSCNWEALPKCGEACGVFTVAHSEPFLSNLIFEQGAQVFNTLLNLTRNIIPWTSCGNQISQKQQSFQAKREAEVTCSPTKNHACLHPCPDKNLIPVIVTDETLLKIQ